MKIGLFFYSTYGRNYTMVSKAAEGVRKAGGEAEILRIPELLSEEILGKMGALEAQKAFSHIPEAEVSDLERFDGFIFGFPTRFGNMPAQFKYFLDATGGLWQSGKLIGKPFGLITSSATQHGGQESTLLTSAVPFLHHGMLYVGVPQNEGALFSAGAMEGGSFYGATTIAGPDGARLPSELELSVAEVLGERVAVIAGKLVS
jgi:NAD(P)H dehydrogenase (quinone)